MRKHTVLPQPIKLAEDHSVRPALGALGAAAVSAPLIYGAIRKPTYSKIKSLRDIQQASGGRFARTVYDAPKTRAGRWLAKKLYDVDELAYTSQKVPKAPKKFEGAVHHFDASFGPKHMKSTVLPGPSTKQVALEDRIGADNWCAGESNR